MYFWLPSLPIMWILMRISYGFVIFIQHIIQSSQGLKPWWTLRNSWCRTSLPLSRFPWEKQGTVTHLECTNSPSFHSHLFHLGLLKPNISFALLAQERPPQPFTAYGVINPSASLPWNIEVLRGERLQSSSQAMGTPGPRVSVEASAAQHKPLPLAICKRAR